MDDAQMNDLGGFRCMMLLGKQFDVVPQKNRQAHDKLKFGMTTGDEVLLDLQWLYVKTNPMKFVSQVCVITRWQAGKAKWNQASTIQCNVYKNI